MTTLNFALARAMSRVFRPLILIASTTALAVCGSTAPAVAAPQTPATVIYVAPDGRGPERGTRTAPYRSIASAQMAARRQLPHLGTDLHVELADGT